MDLWWSTLPTNQKERIAAKGLANDGKPKQSSLYPDCTRWWLTLPAERKKDIHDHCTDKHGLFLSDWIEQRGLSY